MRQSDSEQNKTDYPLLHDSGWLDVMLRHYELDASQFALRFSGRRDWPVREIAEQRHCYPRAEAKLGELHRPGMIYLREALEQASGYATAIWRARNWVRTDSRPQQESTFRVADLTGGLGIDSAAFALAGAQVDYCERNPELAAIARHNHEMLGIASRIRQHTGDGMEWLNKRQASPPPGEAGHHGDSPHAFDLLYIDPSRRPGGKRVLSLQDSEPDVTRHTDLIRSAARRCLIKLSPMMDPVDTVRSLDDCVAVIAVSVDGELKELLADCIPAPGSQASGSGTRRPPVHMAVLLDGSGNERFRFTSDSGATDAPVSGPPGSLLFEPDPSLFKMRLIDEVARRYGLSRIHPEIGYLTDGQPLATGHATTPLAPAGPLATDRAPTHPAPTPSTLKAFPGKVFRIRHVLPYKPRTLKKWLAENGLTGVHIHQRGFPLSVDQLYRKLGCRMGEDAHLFATTAHDGQKVVIVTDRIG